MPPHRYPERPAHGSHYVSRPELAQHVREYQARRSAGTHPACSDPFALILTRIIRGAMLRYRWQLPEDDFIQSALLHLIGRPLDKCDPEQNPFSYLTTCIQRFGLKCVAREQRLLAGEIRYRTDRAEVAHYYGHTLTERDS